jgi:response regulator RpfG family c-di-GMP phosphodiesterase
VSRPWSPSLGPAAAGRLERVRFALRETEVASTSGCFAFVGMLYRFAPDRLAHVQRVAGLAQAMAARLGLGASAVADLERAALGHEIGKVVLPDPPASGVDWPPDRALAAQQVSVAADLLDTIPFLRSAAVVVRAMGEHVDGSGGPLGLTGAAIPMGARILGVADALDVMVAVCRDFGWPSDLAVAELVRHVGIRFDPDVTAAAVQVVDHAPMVPGPFLPGPAPVV